MKIVHEFELDEIVENGTTTRFELLEWLDRLAAESKKFSVELVSYENAEGKIRTELRIVGKKNVDNAPSRNEWVIAMDNFVALHEVQIEKDRQDWRVDTAIRVRNNHLMKMGLLV